MKFGYLVFISSLILSALTAQAAPLNTCPQFEEKVRKCQVLQGNSTQRGLNEQWRKSHVPSLTPEEYGFTLVYIEEGIERPVAAQLTGLKLQKIYEHEELLLASNCIQTDGESSENRGLEGKRWAKVRLPDSFADMCDKGSAYLQMDDHLGADSQVLSVQPTGILVRHSDRLYWLSVQPSNFFPEFRMVWQSSYRVAPSISHSGGKGKSSKRSRKRKNRSPEKAKPSEKNKPQYF